jgi:hypothetical protein
MASDNSLFGQAEELFVHLKRYVELRINDFKFSIARGWVKFVSDIILLILVMVMVFFILMFLSFAFAYWFGEETGRWSLGFILTAAFWAVIALLVYLFRKPLILDNVARATAEDLFSPEKNDENEEDQNV